MIRMIQSKSAGQAKAYYSEALAKSDYYLNDQELAGRFDGRLSKRLGIDSVATKEAFFALCENRHPATDERLTPRTKKERTVGYDINFHVPKSVSILHALSKDNHILHAFQECVGQTMQDIEADVMARVRKGGKYADRQTGELAWAEFVHQTARPVEGYVPDPHLHAHCYVFNVTWDESEKCMKAGQFRDINRDMPYYQALFHKRLSDSLIALGYEVRRTEKSFEVAGVPQKVIDLFSKRTDEIGRIAINKNITDAKELSELGARTRSAKQSGLTMAELKADWKEQIKGLEQGQEDASPIRFAPVKGKALALRNLSLEQCTDYAVSHCFERASVVPMRKLAQTALKQSIGSSLRAEDIMDGLAADARILKIREQNKLLCTTKEVLAEEQRMVRLAQNGKGKFAPLYMAIPDIKAKGQQGDAIRHLLTTSDMVSIVRGAAGTGKTTLMREAIPLIEGAGKRVTVVAPTANASRGKLREEGFGEAQTVAFLLSSKEMQDKLQNGVLWVDEAGMLGTKDMAALLDIASRQHARLVLGGDTRQHASVVRGDALRILNTVGGIRTAEIDKIYRQKDALYRAAVADLSKGNVQGGFDKLDALGAIRQTASSNPYEALARDYIAALKKGKDALVISPTHAQGDLVTDAIRSGLRQQGMIGKKEIIATRLKNQNLTEAEKGDWRNIKEGSVIQFNQNLKGIKRGSQWIVLSALEGEVTISNDQGETLPMPVQRAKDFDVYTESEMTLAKGDKVQITHNGFDKNKTRMNNGQILEVASVSKKSGIKLINPVSKNVFEVGTDFGHLAHAHCLTSHASQGQTVDDVFIAQTSATFPATNAKQFYVSVSRARENIAIYTDDKDMLLHYAQDAGDRHGATELFTKQSIHLDHVQQKQRNEHEPPRHHNEPQQPEQSIDRTSSYNDYEPGI